MTNLIDRLEHIWLSRLVQIPSLLQVQPEFWCRPEQPREPQRRIWRDAAPPIDDLIHPLKRHANPFCQRNLVKP
jgi:hypothetical protein